jgi:alkanesulfonate monooxygenase SsuD/methylene tetrahydromethanopterin reductase-like flavin-dependent oxidoreductase (luciferase family)
MTYFVMLGFNVFTADTDEEAQYLKSSAQQSILRLRRGRPAPFPSPVHDFDSQLSGPERALLDEALACSVTGSPETVRKGLDAFIAQTAADEIMISSRIFDHNARLRSHEIVAEVTGL